jgi:O-6-methylguanine DNA methyltransferase
LLTLVPFSIFDTPLGWVGILGSRGGLRELVLPQPSPEQVWHLLKEIDPGWQRLSCGAYPERDSSVASLPQNDRKRRARNDNFNDLPQRIRDYLTGKAASFPDKLDLSQASPFQRSVWQITQSIPYGETRTYSWVASKLGMPKAAMAVGQALARNPLPIIIPCHRVICKDGSLGGFSGGRNWKEKLLEIEASHTSYSSSLRLSSPNILLNSLTSSEQ